MEEQECSQDFPHYNPMGAICRHGNQSSDPFWITNHPPQWCFRWNLIMIGQLVSEIFTSEVWTDTLTDALMDAGSSPIL